MPATIYSLAPELIRRIIELGSESGEATFLCTASLVHRSWTCDAQGLLWRDLIIEKKGQGAQLVNSPAISRRYQTKSLVFCEGRASPHGYYQTDKGVRETLLNVPGLEELEFRGVDGLIVGMLCFPNLAGLTSLRIYETSIVNQPQHWPITTPSPFTSLQRLELTRCRFPLHVPYSFFFSSSLTNLIFSDALGYRVAPFLLLMAGQLHILDASLCDGFRQGIRELLGTRSFSFASFVNLSTLTLRGMTSDITEALAFLPGSLTSLDLFPEEFETKFRHRVEAVPLLVSLLNAGFSRSVLPHISILRLANVKQSRILEAIGGAEVIKVLESKGITFETPSEWE